MTEKEKLDQIADQISEIIHDNGMRMIMFIEDKTGCISHICKGISDNCIEIALKEIGGIIVSKLQDDIKEFTEIERLKRQN